METTKIITFSDGTEIELRPVAAETVAEISTFAKEQGWEPAWGWEAQMLLIARAAVRGYQDLLRLIESRKGTEADARLVANAVRELMGDTLEALEVQGLTRGQRGS